MDKLSSCGIFFLNIFLSVLLSTQQICPGVVWYNLRSDGRKGLFFPGKYFCSMEVLEVARTFE